MISKNYYKIPWRSSLIIKSLISIFVLLLIIFGLASLFRIHTLKTNMLYALNEEGLYITKITAQAISLPLWNVDDELIKGQLLSLSSGKSFCGARVVDANQQVFANQGFPEVLQYGQYIQSQDVFYNGSSPEELENIGRIDLCISKKNAESEIKKAIHFELIFFSIIIIFSLAAYYAAFFIIASPLLHIRRAMETLDETMEPIRDEKLLRPNEIGALSLSFNKMIKKISLSYNALKIEKERAVKADMAKTEFLTNMSHELRTPLNIIIGLAQILKSSDVSDEHRESFEILKNSSKSLLHIVDDILDLSKIESGEIDLEKIEFGLNKKIIDVIKNLQPLADEKKLGFNYILLNQEYFVLSDPVRFERILTNLISNAIRYTEKGSIKIETIVIPNNDNTILFECSVIDTGIGIEPKNLEKIFEKFSQADNSITRLYGGTGLGLTITKKLLSLMGGGITLKSEINAGSTFTFTLPFPILEKNNFDNKNDEHKTVKNSQLLSQAKILLAEDNHINQIFMKKLFEGLGIHNVKIVSNGLEAVKEIHKNKYDIILMDYSMPIMSGYEATIHIRNSEDKRVKETPIIALTANALASDRQKFAESGMNAFISKPFELENFKAILSEWIDIKS